MFRHVRRPSQFSNDSSCKFIPFLLNFSLLPLCQSQTRRDMSRPGCGMPESQGFGTGSIFWCASGLASRSQPPRTNFCFPGASFNKIFIIGLSPSAKPCMSGSNKANHTNASLKGFCLVYVRNHFRWHIQIYEILTNFFILDRQGSGFFVPLQTA